MIEAQWCCCKIVFRHSYDVFYSLVKYPQSAVSENRYPSLGKNPQSGTPTLVLAISKSCSARGHNCACQGSALLASASATLTSAASLTSKNSTAASPPPPPYIRLRLGHARIPPSKSLPPLPEGENASSDVVDSPGLRVHVPLVLAP